MTSILLYDYRKNHIYLSVGNRLILHYLFHHTFYDFPCPSLLFFTFISSLWLVKKEIMSLTNFFLTITTDSRSSTASLFDFCNLHEKSCRKIVRFRILTIFANISQPMKSEFVKDFRNSRIVII